MLSDLIEDARVFSVAAEQKVSHIVSTLLLVM